MKLKSCQIYALRAVLYLAARGGTCPSVEIARAMSVPRDYLTQLAQPLRDAGIVESRMGKDGGYRLARDPSDVSAWDVIDAVGRERPAVVPELPPDSGPDARLAAEAADACGAVVEFALRHTTLATLLRGAHGEVG